MPSKTTRREKGEGSLYQREDGRWAASVQVGGVRQTVYADSKGQAAAKLKPLTQAASETRSLPTAGKTTVGDFLADWLEHHGERIRPKTRETYGDVLRLYILPAIGSVKLRDLAPLHLVRFYTTAGKRSRRRAQQAHALLCVALGDAVRWGLLASAPTDRVDRPAYTPPERRPWDAAQSAHFVRALLDDDGRHYGGLFGYLLATGCREGEALGLDWADVDLARGTAWVHWQVTFVDNAPTEGPPKTRASLRTVHLPAWGVALLGRQREMSARWRARCATWPTTDRVFTTDVGTTPTPSLLRRSLHALCHHLGLPVVHVHDLRHGHASLALQAGVPLPEVSKALGHSRVSVTANTYAHILGDGRATAMAMEKLLAPGKEGG